MKTKGFTLVELVVAIAILGVITLIAIPTIKSVQQTNSKTKYVTYEKAVTAAGKSFTDAYEEDLFGSSNSGCAIIHYADLKSKDLIQDIQIKNNTCENSCIYVKKTKNGNYHYETQVTCKEGSNIIFGNGKACNADLCKIEDGKGPEYTIADTSPYKDNPKYKKGQDPKIRINISDKGIGLKEKQTLKYEWYKGSTKIVSSTINFNNKAYAPSATKFIPNAPNMSDVTDSTTYRLVVTGTIKDVDLNETPVTKEIKIEYFVGRVIIKYNANGGSLGNTTNGNIKVNTTNGKITINGKEEIHVIKEGEKLSPDGLINWNNNTYLNLVRSGYSIKSGYEWNTKADGTGDNYNQTEQYSYSNFCNKLYEDCNVTLYANWKKVYTYTIKFYYQGYHAAFNPDTQTRSCTVFEPGESCTVTAPGINNLPATSACGSAYSSLLVIQGWNTDAGATTGVSGNISVNRDTNYYSIITPNSAYVNNYSFQVYGHTCNSSLTSRNVLERYSPAEGSYPARNDITSIKEEAYFVWTGAWAIYGAATNPDHDNDAWLYLHGIGTSCRYAYRKKNGKHPSSTCQYSWIKAFQLRWY